MTLHTRGRRGEKINERIPGRIVPTRCGRMGQLRDGNSDRIYVYEQRVGRKIETIVDTDGDNLSFK